MINIVIFFSIVVLLVFSFKLIINTQGNKLLNVLLATLVLLCSFPYITLVAYAQSESPFYILVTMTSAVLAFLVPPVSYLYVRCYLLDEKKLRSSDLLHLIPFILALLNIFPSLINPVKFTSEVSNGITFSKDYTSFFYFMPFRSHFIFRAFVALFYLFISFRMYVKSLQGDYGKMNLVDKIWIAYFLFIRISFLLLTYFYSRKVLFSENMTDYIKFNLSPVPILLLSLITYLIIIFSKPNLKYGNINRRLALDDYNNR
jgi:hypothetical protein